MLGSASACLSLDCYPTFQLVFPMPLTELKHCKRHELYLAKWFLLGEEPATVRQVNSTMNKVMRWQV